MLYNIVFEVFSWWSLRKRVPLSQISKQIVLLGVHSDNVPGRRLLFSGQSRIVFTKIELHDKKCKVDFCCISF